MEVSGCPLAQDQKPHAGFQASLPLSSAPAEKKLTEAITKQPPPPPPPTFFLKIRGKNKSQFKKKQAFSEEGGNFPVWVRL